jgi:hypothetical protein
MVVCGNLSFARSPRGTISRRELFFYRDAVSALSDAVTTVLVRWHPERVGPCEKPPEPAESR